MLESSDDDNRSMCVADGLCVITKPWASLSRSGSALDDGEGGGKPLFLALLR